MPQRPREHVLESLSRSAFRRLVEEQGWVVRPVDSPDYGIDDQVEIFSDGQATGLVFYVQVRATDETDLRRALSVRIRPEQQAYFAAIGHPVLVVRYMAERGRLFARWFHGFDPHPMDATATFRLEQSDELTDEAVEAFASEVRLFRVMSSTRVPWPVAVKVSARGRHTPSDAVIAMTAVAVEGCQRYVRFVPADQRTHTVELTLKLLSDRIVIHGGRSSLTLHGDTDKRDLTDLASDAVLGVGLVLGAMGQLDAAATLIKATGPDAPSFRGELLSMATAALAGGRRLAEALGIGRALTAQSRWFEATFLVGMVSMVATEFIGNEEREGVVAFSEELADAAEAAGATKEAASVSYSLGNWLLYAVHDASRAVSMYKRAEQLDSSYAGRDYFQREHAAALVECRRYAEAVGVLEALLDADRSRETVARLADALLLAGRFGDAASMFSRYLSEPDSPAPGWLLTAVFARMLVEEGFEEQDRHDEEARALVAEAEAISDENNRIAKAREALACDALCSSAWWLIGRSRTGKNPRDAVLPMIAGALGLRSPGAWAATLFVLQLTGNDELARAAAAHALLQHGAGFQDAIRQARGSPLRDLADSSLALVSEVEDTLVRPIEGFSLRIVNRNGVITELGFRAEEPSD